MRRARIRAPLYYFALVLLLSGTVAGAAEKPTREVLMPEGGIIRQHGDQMDIFDCQGKREGYGVRRPVGSWDLFRKDGSRLGTIERGIGGTPDRLIIQKPGRRK